MNVDVPWMRHCEQGAPRDKRGAWGPQGLRGLGGLGEDSIGRSVTCGLEAKCWAQDKGLPGLPFFQFRIPGAFRAGGQVLQAVAARRRVARREIAA